MLAGILPVQYKMMAKIKSIFRFLCPQNFSSQWHKVIIPHDLAWQFKTLDKMMFEINMEPKYTSSSYAVQIYPKYEWHMIQ